MLMSRRTLRRLAVWLLLPLLFAQWATASYACPQVGGTGSPVVAMPDMPDCQGMAPGAAMDPEQPLLCKAHCDHGSQSVNDLSPVVPSPQLLLWAVLDWNVPALKSAHREEPAHDRSIPALSAGSPPLYLLLLALRN